MASKLQQYSQLADRTAQQITGSYQMWTAFLETAARLYKYPYHEQLMQLLCLYSDMTEFHNRLHREVLDETYPRLQSQPRSMSQEDIDDALRAWNGSIESKRAVVRYMEQHGREKDTAEWLSREYGGDPDTPLHLTRTGTDADVVMPWPKVQRRIARLIKEDRFFTEQERDNFDDIDPVAIREALEPRGIVDGKVVDPEKLDQDPFIRQVTADVERIAQEEQSQVTVLSGQQVPPYKVGDTVYLDNTAFEITAVRQFDVELRDPALAYPIFRAENKARFEIMLHQDPRNSDITEYLAQDLNNSDSDLPDVLTWDGGLLTQQDKMDVDVARLKLMKANHQSQQYRLEDNIPRYFPEQIEQAKGFIAGFEADMQTLAAHPHPKDGFVGMEVRGDLLTDKENAGAALLDAFKEVKGLEPLPIGTYRGFQMSLTFEDFGRNFILTLKGQMSHRVELGKDPRGNLTRIENVLNAMPDRMAVQQSRLDNLYAQIETAKAELGKPFPQEEELRQKSARLAQLNIELNIDDRTPMEQLAEEAPTVAKSSRPSVIEKLRAPLPAQAAVKPKSRELEV